MMHAQVVGVKPAPPGNPTITGTTGSGPNRANVISWADNSKNETGFVVQRRLAGTTSWTTIATVASETLGTADYTVGTGAAKGTRTYNDRVGNDRRTYEYNVYAINTVGDVWDYSNPAFNEIPPGGGFPTLTLDSRGDQAAPTTTVTAPSNLTASLTVKNKKTSTVRLSWTDNSDNETGFIVQRSDNAGNVVNTTIAAGLTTFTQDVTSGQTFYYRVAAFNDTAQSTWSNTAQVPAP